jgi:quinol monooxygenase YgiN
MEVTVHAILTWDAGRREEAIAYMLEQGRATREMPGCAGCWWAADIEDPAVFHQWSRWESEDAFADQVRNGPKYSEEARALIRRVMAHRYDVASTTKLH